MNLFQKAKKPLFEDVAKQLEVDASQREKDYDKMVEMASTGSQIFDNPKAASIVFGELRKKIFEGMRCCC